MSKKRVKLKLGEKMLESIRATLEENPWMGFESVEDFVEEAIRRYLEHLYGLRVK